MLADFLLSGDMEKLLFLCIFGWWLTWSELYPWWFTLIRPKSQFNVLDEVFYLLHVVLRTFSSLPVNIVSQLIELPDEVSPNLPQYPLENHVLPLSSWKIKFLLGFEGFLDPPLLFIFRSAQSLTNLRRRGLLAVGISLGRLIKIIKIVWFNFFSKFCLGNWLLNFCPCIYRMYFLGM